MLKKTPELIFYKFRRLHIKKIAGTYKNINSGILHKKKCRNIYFGIFTCKKKMLELIKYKFWHFTYKKNGRNL